MHILKQEIEGFYEEDVVYPCYLIARENGLPVTVQYEQVISRLTHRPIKNRYIQELLSPFQGLTGILHIRGMKQPFLDMVDACEQHTYWKYPCITFTVYEVLTSFSIWQTFNTRFEYVKHFVANWQIEHAPHDSHEVWLRLPPHVVCRSKAELMWKIHDSYLDGTCMFYVVNGHGVYTPFKNNFLNGGYTDLTIRL